MTGKAVARIQPVELSITLNIKVEVPYVLGEQGVCQTMDSVAHMIREKVSHELELISAKLKDAAEGMKCR